MDRADRPPGPPVAGCARDRGRRSHADAPPPHRLPLPAACEPAPLEARSGATADRGRAAPKPGPTEPLRPTAAADPVGREDWRLGNRVSLGQDVLDRGELPDPRGRALGLRALHRYAPPLLHPRVQQAPDGRPRGDPDPGAALRPRGGARRLGAGAPLRPCHRQGGSRQVRARRARLRVLP